jgi:alpha-tubulin suppressor-like RCC1 family protein
MMVTALGGDAKLGVGGGIVTFGGFSAIPALQPTDLAADGDRICLVQGGKVLCTDPDEPMGSLEDLCAILGQCGFRLGQVQGLTEQAVAVDVAPDHACAVMASGKVACWGRNDRGQLGHAPGTGGDVPCPEGKGVCNFVPSYVASLAGATDVSAGSAGGLGTSCALSGVTLSCWGSNQFGQLGLGSADSEPHPEPSPVLSQFRTVSVAATGVCAVSLNGGAYCWGDDSGELNLQARQPREVGRLSEVTAGVQIPLTNVVQIDRGQSHACAVDTDGRVWCWGSNAHGELGRGRSGVFDGVCTVGRRARLCSVPGASRVESITGVADVAVGGRHTCASRRDGKVLCWGNNSDGQVGKPVKEPEDARNFTSATAVAGSTF